MTALGEEDMYSHTTELCIVDDTSNLHETIAEYLGDEYTIYYASEGAEYWQELQSIESVSLEYDDLQLPVMNGMLLIQKNNDADFTSMHDSSVIMLIRQIDKMLVGQVDVYSDEYIH